MSKNVKMPTIEASANLTETVKPSGGNVQFSLTTTEGTKPITRPPQPGGKGSKGGKKGK